MDESSLSIGRVNGVMGFQFDPGHGWVKEDDLYPKRAPHVSYQEDFDINTICISAQHNHLPRCKLQVNSAKNGNRSSRTRP